MYQHGLDEHTQGIYTTAILLDPLFDILIEQDTNPKIWLEYYFVNAIIFFCDCMKAFEKDNRTINPDTTETIAKTL